MEITAKVYLALERQKGVSERTGNSWSKQEFVIETMESYPRKYKISIFGEDRLNELNLKTGDKIVAEIAPGTAREYNGRWYSDDPVVRSIKRLLTEGEALVQATKETIDYARVNASSGASATSAPAVAPADEKKEEGDGLPF